MTHPSHNASYRFQSWELDGPGVATCIDCTMRFSADDAKPCVDCKDDLCPECHKGHGGKCATCHCNALDGAA